MDQTNTQGGQDAQSLQPQAGQTQGSASRLQTGSGAGLSSSDNSNILNQGVAAGDLNVGVAGASSRTSITPPNTVTPANSGVSVLFVLIPLALFLFALVLAYRRMRKSGKAAGENTLPEEEMLEDLTWTTKAEKKKKKRKKPKKPHHH